MTNLDSLGPNLDMKRQRKRRENMLHIINTYYEPTEEAKKFYGQLKSENPKTILMNSGNLDKEAEWNRDNLTFEADFHDNIAHLNPHFCEMTAQYAIWKSLELPPDNEYIRFSHYRKFLQLPNELTADIYATNPHPMIFNVNGKKVCATIESGTRYCHPTASWEMLKWEISQTCTFREWQRFNDWSRLAVMPAPMNLFCMKVGLFKEWVEWVFPKLFAINSRIPYDTEEYKTAYQQRAIAFIAERLFSLWCYNKVSTGTTLEEVPNFVKEGFKPITDQEERNIKL